MSKRRWKNRQPSTMQEAIRLCLDYALHKHNRSVARVAELVGVTEWVVYKWMSEGSIPSKRIRPFEFACDSTFVTRYIATSANKLVIDIPNGNASSQDDLLDLQNTLNNSVSLLTRFYRGDAEAADVLQGLTRAMEHLAGHRENVNKHNAPELALFDGDE
jgi:phage terminase Nu1 subunit (DNA packaging protein)